MITLVQLLVVCIVLGLLYWLVTLLPLPSPFKAIAMCIVILIAIVWLLSLVGLLPRLRAQAAEPPDGVSSSATSVRPSARPVALMLSNTLVMHASEQTTEPAGLAPARCDQPGALRPPG